MRNKSPTALPGRGKASAASRVRVAFLGEGMIFYCSYKLGERAAMVESTDVLSPAEGLTLDGREEILMNEYKGS